MMSAATHICDKCHQAVPPTKPPRHRCFDDDSCSVTLETGALWVPGPLSWAVLKELRKHVGQLVTYEQILSKVNAGRSDPTTPRCLYMTIFYIRRHLANTPWRIRSVHRRGFIMEMVE